MRPGRVDRQIVLSSGAIGGYLRAMSVRPLIVMVSLALAAAAPAAADERRCLAMIAYAEAAGEGDAGMAAVIRVVRNRIADEPFPDAACAVVAQKGQFQPVSMSSALAAAIADPAVDAARALRVDTDRERRVLGRAFALSAEPADADPTAGAVFFVNPYVMDPANCPWFARLKRTVTIGAHVFLTHYGQGEARQPPAIDCATAGAGFRDWLKGWGHGVMAQGRPKIASITPTPAMLRKWKASGRLEARQQELRRRVAVSLKGQD
jgi:hypothetical protein